MTTHGGGRRGRSGMGRAAIAAVSLLSLLAPGCLRVHSIAPEEIRKLDGFTEKDRVELRDTIGKPVVFSREASLWVITGQQRLGPWNFLEIRVGEEEVSARLQGGPRVQLPLKSIRMLQVSEEDARSTAEATFTDLTTTASLAMVALLALGIAIVVLVFTGGG